MKKPKNPRVEKTLEELEKQIEERSKTMPGCANQGRKKKPGVYVIRCGRRWNNHIIW